MMKITLRRSWQTKEGVDKYIYATCHWQVHEQLDGLAHQELYNAGYRCTSVEVSEEERAWIGRNYTSIPRCSPSMKHTEKWQGDHAVFIYDNLPRFYDKEWGYDPRVLNSR